VELAASWDDAAEPEQPVSARRAATRRTAKRRCALIVVSGGS
jgi:hypothetical protein